MSTFLSVLVIVLYVAFIVGIIWVIVHFLRKRNTELKVFHTFIYDELKKIETSLNMIVYHSDDE